MKSKREIFDVVVRRVQKYDSSSVLLAGGNARSLPVVRGVRIFPASIFQRVSTNNGVYIPQRSLRPSVPIQIKAPRSSASGGIELRGSIHSLRDEFIVQSNTSASPKRIGPSFRPREALGETHLLCTSFLPSWKRWKVSQLECSTGVHRKRRAQ